MPKIDSRLLDLTDPVVAENFNRTISATEIAAIALTADSTGKITGGTATTKGGKKVTITVTTAT
nr:MAG TPA: hypothetical protein [Caudoviricetes sp.]